MFVLLCSVLFCFVSPCISVCPSICYINENEVTLNFWFYNLFFQSAEITSVCHHVPVWKNLEVKPRFLYMLSKNSTCVHMYKDYNPTTQRFFYWIFKPHTPRSTLTSINMASLGSAGCSHQNGPRSSTAFGHQSGFGLHAAQTIDICMFLGSNMGHRHLHRP